MSPGFNNTPLLLSTVTKDVFPETPYTSLHRASLVSFQSKDSHLLLWKSGDVGKLEDKADDLAFRITPTYRFESPEACRSFQNDVRDKELIEVFDTDAIWTDRTEKRQDRRESECQDLKLWRGRTGDQFGNYSLTFKVTNGVSLNHHYVECELRRFAPTTRTGGKGHADIIYLDFADSEADRDSRSSGTRLTRFSQLFSGSRAPQQRSKASRASLVRRPSLSLITGVDFFSNLRFLAVKFSEMETANGQGIEAPSEGEYMFPCSRPTAKRARLLDSALCIQSPPAFESCLKRNAKRG